MPVVFHRIDRDQFNDSVLAVESPGMAERTAKVVGNLESARLVFPTGTTVPGRVDLVVVKESGESSKRAFVFRGGDHEVFIG